MARRKRGASGGAALINEEEFLAVDTVIEVSADLTSEVDTIDSDVAAHSNDMVVDDELDHSETPPLPIVEEAEKIDSEKNTTKTKSVPKTDGVANGKARGRKKKFTGPTRFYNIDLTESERTAADDAVTEILKTSDVAITLGDVINERLIKYCAGEEVYAEDAIPRLKEGEKIVVYKIVLPIQTTIDFKDFKKALLDAGITHVNSMQDMCRYLIIELGKEAPRKKATKKRSFVIA